MLLLLLVLAPLLPMAEATQGRSTIVRLEFTRHDWTSNEVVEVDLRLRNAPFNEQLRAEWILGDEQGFLDNGTLRFTASGTFTVIDLDFSAFYRGSHFHDVEVMVYDESGALLGTAEIEFVVFRNVKMAAPASLLAFGDSLSDMGNAKASILNTPDVPPYWQGRFSNGEVWLGGLYDAYGLTSSIGSGLASSGANRAFGGAQTGSGYAYLLIPNVGTQITNYLANVQATVPTNAVVSLWAGGNDFLYGSANADTIAANMEAHIRQLAGAGARTFVIPNLPPLEDTPEIQGRSASQQATIRNEVIDYNNQLATIIVNLRAELGITVHSVDAWSIFGDITNNKAALGLTNVQDAACSGGSTLLPLPICNSRSSIAANVDEYVFFDKAHPTRVMHDIIARYAIEAVGEPDTDGDGVIDVNDACDWTPTAEQADLSGCAWSQRDDDLDGVDNGRDLCPGTVSEEPVDADGCSTSQRDSDSDGLNDAVDPCPLSPNLFDHDGDGCADSEDEDDDNDGVDDEEDACPQGLLNPHLADLDGDGCADTEDIDVDGDGLSNNDEANANTDPRDEDTDDDTWLDGEDAFPLDATEWKDTDLDGCGDNMDRFPFDPSECTDADEDGYGDNADAFPTDDTEWNDLDGDGVGDNADACLLEYGLSAHPPGCPDRDGDGYANTNDTFPNDPTEWSDQDGDGYGDNVDLFPSDASDWADQDNDTYGDNRDAFPLDPNEWNDTDGEGVGDNSDRFPSDASEWNDTDDDGCGDNSDVFPLDPNECYDSDFDGIGDRSDAFPDDAREWLDSDGDGIGDVADRFPNDPMAAYDSDGDGVADAYDAFPDSATFSSWLGVLSWLGAMLVLFGGAAVIYGRRQVQPGDSLVNVEIEHWGVEPSLRPARAPTFERPVPEGPTLRAEVQHALESPAHIHPPPAISPPAVPPPAVSPPAVSPPAFSLPEVEQLGSEGSVPSSEAENEVVTDTWGALDSEWTDSP